MLERFTRWLDALSYHWLVVLSLFVALAPWPAGPEPHLLEKCRMLVQGTLVRPLDIFDLVFHASPLVLLIAKGVRDLVDDSSSDSAP